MSSSLFRDLAWGVVTGATGVLVNGRGCTVVRTGAGEYEITLSEGLAVADSETMMTVTPIDPTNLHANFDVGTTTVKKVKSFNTAGLLTDADFCFKIEALKLI